MGLFPQGGNPMPLPTPSPADISSRLMEQATQRAMFSQQAIRSTPMAMMSGLGAQFQQQYQLAQSIQSLSPYQASMMSGGISGGPGGGPSYLPSPLSMTPAQTGVFRPPMQQPMMPLPPMYTPPIVQTPWTPQMPQTMFRSPWEQQSLTQDFQSNRMFSYGMQAPSILGQAAGLGAGAYAGARAGAAFGNVGRLAGAVGGAALMGGSGIAGTLGDFSQLPFQPFVETRQMGGAMQRMSQDWVVSGSQMHAMGRGLSQRASIDLAGGIKDLAVDSDFKSQTGEMFNRMDLSRITQMSGQAGLMDMSQSVPQIKDQLKQVATTVKRFMELTNDPDVTNVIREMGQLRQFGMTMPQINQAAENMRMFSRAAGASISEMRQSGGMPGAAVYQGMGLTAAQGFEYGNYSMAQARQTVASGGVSTQQLALFGGVQGMAQRNMQAQAAFTSMPMFAAAQAQFGTGSWGASATPGAMGGGMGAFGMVNAAVQNLGQGVAQGGIGALVSFPLKQKEIADAAAAKMTPMEQTAQRFRMAMQTGRMFGLKGQAAMDMGARLMYGDDVAAQMSVEAKDPNMWLSQQKMYKQRLTELTLEQQQARDARAPGLLSRLGIHGPSNPFEGAGEVLGRGFTELGNTVDDFLAETEGTHRYRKHAGTGQTANMADALTAGDIGSVLGKPTSGTDLANYKPGSKTTFMEDYRRNTRLAQDYEILGKGGSNALKYANNVFNALSFVPGMNAVGLAGSVATSEWGRGSVYASLEGSNAGNVSEWANRIRNDTVAGNTAGKLGVADAKQRSKVRTLMEEKYGKGAFSAIQAAGKGLAAAAKTEAGRVFQGGTVPVDSVTANALLVTALVALPSNSKKTREEVALDLERMKLNEPDKYKAMLAGVNTEAREVGGTVVADHLDKTSDKYQGGLADSVSAATENIQDYQETELNKIEEGLGLRSSILGVGFDSSGMDDFKTWAQGGTDKTLASSDVALMAIMNNDETAAEKMYYKNGGKEGTWDEKRAELITKRGNIGKKNEELLEKLGKGGYESALKWSRGLREQGTSASIRSEAFSSIFTKNDKGGLQQALRQQGADGVTNIDSFLSNVSDDTLATMDKGTAEERAYAKLARQGKAGDADAKLKLSKLAAKKGGADVEDTVMGVAAGGEADRARRSSDGAGEMAMVAQDLIPAAKDLRVAAKLMLESNTLYRLKNLLGDKD